VYKNKLTINGYDYLIRVAGYSSTINQSYYNVYQMGFGYLDRFSKYRKTNMFNGGYYQGFYMIGYERNYLITIGAKRTEAYNYLKKLYGF